MYFNKYLKYKIKYLYLLIKKGGSNDDIVNISCKINKNNKLNIKDEGYRNFDIFECLDKNNYLNELKKKQKDDDYIKKSYREELNILLNTLQENTIQKNKLNKDIRDLNRLVKKNNINEKKLLDEKNKNKKLHEQILKKKKDYEDIRNKLLIVFNKLNINNEQKYKAMVTGLRIKIDQLTKEINNTNKIWSDYSTYIIETNSEAEKKQNMKRIELEKELKKLKVKLQKNEKQLNVLKPLNVTNELKKTILNERKNIYLEAIKMKLEHCNNRNRGCTKEIIDGFNKRLHDMKLNIDLYDFFYLKKRTDKYFLKFDYKSILDYKIKNNLQLKKE